MTIELALVTKTISMQCMREYSGAAGIHSDDQAAQAQGLSGALVQGGQLVGYLNEMMVRSLGGGFIEGGEIAVSFVQPVRDGDVVQTRGEMTSSTRQERGERLEFDVWLQNQRGEKVTVGKAIGWGPPTT